MRGLPKQPLHLSYRHFLLANPTTKSWLSSPITSWQQNIWICVFAAMSIDNTWIQPLHLPYMDTLCVRHSLVSPYGSTCAMRPDSAKPPNLSSKTSQHPTNCHKLSPPKPHFAFILNCENYNYGQVSFSVSKKISDNVWNWLTLSLFPPALHCNLQTATTGPWQGFLLILSPRKVRVGSTQKQKQKQK